MATDTSIACPHYRAVEGSRRCRDYLQGGGCVRNDQFMCTEFLRLNPKREAAGRLSTARGPSSARADPVGDAATSQSSPRQSAARAEPTEVQELTRSLFGEPGRIRQAATPLLHAPFTSEATQTSNRPVGQVSGDQLLALEQLGIEVCVRTDAVEELWLVPAHTQQSRNEMTFRDAATLATLCAVFPGASVTKFSRRTEDA